MDNQQARVRVRQIFDNHTGQQQEGKYLFALPPCATISDFAVWDGDTRIPGVMLEKRRANAAHGDIKQRGIDPGLLQQDDEQGGTSAFSAKIFPIPAYGSKRVEMEYSEMLPLEGLSAHFTFPLKPAWGAAQTVGEFNLRVQITDDAAMSAPVFAAPSYPVRVLQADEHQFAGEFTARNVKFAEDFAFDYRIVAPQSGLSFIAYRAPEQISAYDLRDPAQAARNPDGYFAAQAIFSGLTDRNAPPASRNLVLLFDVSLSMYGEKLARAVAATDFFLHSLTPADRFNLILFNDSTRSLADEPLTGTPENVEKALDFLKSSSLSSGTDLREALTHASAQAAKFPAGEHSIVLISDANPTLGTLDIKQIIATLDKSIPTKPRLFAFGLGSDANQTLLAELARQTHGYFTQVRETEDISAALPLFWARLGTPNIENLQLQTPGDFYQIYALQDIAAEGASAAFVGRYRQPSASANLSLTANYGAASINLARNVVLPDFADTHAHLPRLWARARVDTLIREMDLNGEREDYISEIIRLSQRYKFVTPYTAFLAAPRSLLRPRLIQPGDPVLRVRTDAAITAVFAVLPFGETLPLRYLPQEKVWAGRFLAPAWLPDGTYQARLLLTDKDGNGYQEDKSFVIDSHAPRLRAIVNRQQVLAGEELKLSVTADSDTLRLTAKMYGAQPVALRWSDADKANTGRLRVPQGLASGKYIVTVTAEDFAHNQSSAEIEITVSGS